MGDRLAPRRLVLMISVQDVARFTHFQSFLHVLFPPDLHGLTRDWFL